MSDNEVIEIVGARKEQAAEIASLIMEAMDYDCCQNFAGEAHTLDDFHRMMTALVEMDDSQYSYRNTLVALVDGQLVGCLVGYDGKDLRRLRKRFIEKAAEYLERDLNTAYPSSIETLDKLQEDIPAGCFRYPRVRR